VLVPFNTHGSSTVRCLSCTPGVNLVVAVSME